MNTPWKTMLRWTSVLVVLVAIAFGTVRSAQAFEVNEDGVIPDGEVIDDDVLIGGNNVVINGTVNGDVFAFGSIVTLNGVINGSMFAGAQNVVVNGEITGSLFVGASALDLGSEAVVGRNVLFGARASAATCSPLDTRHCSPARSIVTSKCPLPRLTSQEPWAGM